MQALKALLSTSSLSNQWFVPGGACYIAHFSKLAQVSSTTTSTSALFECLIETFKFPKTQALSIAARFPPLKSSQKPQALFIYFRNLGFSHSHIQLAVFRRPQILFANIDKNLKPKIQHFHNLGHEGSRLGLLVARLPALLTASLKKRLGPRLQTLQNIASQYDLAKGVERCCWVLVKYPESRLLSNIALLQSCGIVGSQLSMLFRMQPRIFLSEESRLRDLVSRTLDFGFSVKSRMFVHGLYTVSGRSCITLERKFAIFSSYGFSKEECMEMFRKAPVLLRFSEEKLKFGMDFYLNTVKLTKNVVVYRPVLLMYSMKDRVVPRYHVLRAVESKGLLEKKKKPNLCTVLSLTNDRFLEKFVCKYLDDAEELFMVYKATSSEVAEYL
ncbi:Transcription termination factor MTERF8, chloroplastic [Linum perenne]